MKKNYKDCPEEEYLKLCSHTAIEYWLSLTELASVKGQPEENKSPINDKDYHSCEEEDEDYDFSSLKAIRLRDQCLREATVVAISVEQRLI